MIAFLRRVRESWRRSGKQLEANAIENTRVAQAAAEREKLLEPKFPPGRGAGTWVAPQ